MMEKQYEDVEQEFWSFNTAGESISGIYRGMEKDVGENKANVYNIEKDDGKVICIWGSMVLDQKMKLVCLGDELRIIYEGIEKPEKGKTYKKFKVQRVRKQ